MYAIIYATKSKMLRRIIATDAGLKGNEVGVGPSFAHQLAPGESVYYASAGNADDLPYWENHVHIATGVVPPDARCVAVDNKTKTVKHVLLADPDIDAIPDHTLVTPYSLAIDVGHTYDPDTKLFSTPEVTLPPLSEGNPSANPVVVPAAVIPNPSA